MAVLMPKDVLFGYCFAGSVMMSLRLDLYLIGMFWWPISILFGLFWIAVKMMILGCLFGFDYVDVSLSNSRVVGYVNLDFSKVTG